MYEVINGLTAFFVMQEESLIATILTDQFATPEKAEQMANFVSKFNPVLTTLKAAQLELVSLSTTSQLADEISKLIEEIHKIENNG